MRQYSLVFVATSLILALASAPLLVSAQTPPLVLGTDFYAPTDSPMPQKGTAFVDPNFHTTLVRITDKTDGYTDSGIENEYAKTDPENCDGTLLVLRGNDGEWYLYSASTYQMIKQFGGWFVDGVEPEPRWDTTDPNVLYYLYETQLRSCNVQTEESAMVHDFKADFPSAAYITTGVEGNPSLDQRYWSFMVENADYDLIATVVYDKQTDSIVGQRTQFPDNVEDISMDMSGSHCMVGFESHVLQICSRDFSSVQDLPDGANGHNDFALTSDGRDVLVYQNTQTDYIAMVDLETLVETQLLAIPFNVNIDIGLHISGNCADKPGWVLVSTYGAKNPPAGDSHSWMDTQLFMLQLQPNPLVWRIVHTQAYTSEDYDGEKNYFAEAFATVNNAGTRVYFGSNWGDFADGYTDTYIVFLPSDWFVSVPEFPFPLVMFPLLLVTVSVVVGWMVLKKRSRQLSLSPPPT